MPRVKEPFQAALQKTPRLAKLINLELDDKINALNALAQTAESRYWNMTAAEFEATGRVTDNARDIADHICSSAETLVNQILTDIKAICEEAVHTPLDWSQSTYTKQSLYAPAVAEVTSALLAKTSAMRTMLAAVHDSATYDATMASFATFYEWAAGILGQFGPNFPTPLTAFGSAFGDIEYLLPQIGAAINAAGQLEFTNYISPAVAEDFNADSSGFHELGIGDTILIERLDAGDSLGNFTPFVGMHNLTIVSDGESEPAPILDPLTLEAPDSLSLGEELVLALSAAATRHGEVFRFRKIKGA